MRGAAHRAHRTEVQPAFYGRTGSTTGDLLTIFHPPYTAWHLSYVVYGAAVSPELDFLRLTGTLAAFLFGTGVAAHALDEWRSRPLRTGLSDRALLTVAVFGILAAVVTVAAGVFVISPWVAAWGVVGVALMLGYVLEWRDALHSDLAFGLAWGGFPVLVGYWAQAERVDPAVLLVALAATLLSLAQRALSTPARRARRSPGKVTTIFERADGVEHWSRDRLLTTWESPLKLLCAGVVVLAGGLIATRM